MAGVKRVVLPARPVESECLCGSDVACSGERNVSHGRLHLVMHLSATPSMSTWTIITTNETTNGRAISFSFLSSSLNRGREGPIRSRERLGGLLKYYAREAT